MDTLFGLPIGVYLIALIISAVLLFIASRLQGTETVSKVLNAYDGSALDLYVTEMFHTLEPRQREAIRDVIEIMSPITERTPNDADDKTVKILSDYIQPEETEQEEEG